MTDDVFSSATNEDQTNDSFSSDTGSTQENQSVIENLVGEGKKFKDVESLARGKVEADKFIDNLKRELQELRSELSKQEYSKELLTQLQNKATGSGTVGNEAGKAVSENTNSKTLSTDDVKALVAAHLKEEEVKRTSTENIRKADQELRKLYGEKTPEVLKLRAQELGLSVERMREMAAESPSALLRLVGADNVKPVDTSVPKTQVNSTNYINTGSTERDWEWWQKLRKESKNKYHSPEMAKLRYKDMDRLGPRFGGPMNQK